LNYGNQFDLQGAQRWVGCRRISKLLYPIFDEARYADEQENVDMVKRGGH